MNCRLCFLLLVIFSFSSVRVFSEVETVDEYSNKIDSLEKQKAFDEAIILQKKLLSASHRKNWDSLFARLYNTYKTYYLSEGESRNWGKALNIALESRAICLDNISSRDEAELIYNLAYLYDKNQKYFLALNHYKQAISLYEALADSHEQAARQKIAMAYNNIGVVHAHTGFFTERRSAYLKAKELWESVEEVDESYLMTIYGNLLRLYYQYGDKEGAKELIRTVNMNFDEWLANDSLKKEKRSLGLDPGFSFEMHQVNKHRLNLLYTDMMDDKHGGIAHLDSLSTYFMQLSAEDQRQYSAYWLTAIQNTAGPLVDYSIPEERRLQKHYLDLAMEESIRLGDRYNEMISHSRLVSYYLNAEQDSEQAIWHLDQAIAIGLSMDIREFNLLNLYLKKGDVLQQSGQFLEAEQLVLKGMSVILDRPIADLSSVQIDNFDRRNDIFYIGALKQVASIYKNEYEHTGNLVHAHLAQQFFELAARLFNVYYQKGVYNPKLNMYNNEISEGLLVLHMELGGIEADLINLTENNRSKHLSKEFNAKYLRFLNVPDSLFAEYNLLQLELSRYEKKEAFTEASKEEYERLKDDLQEVVDQIQKYDAKYFSFFSDSLSVQKVQMELEDGEYIVRYTVAHENVYAYVIQNKDLSIVKLGDRDSILLKVERYHETLKTIQNNYQKQARALYDALIAPLELPLDEIRSLVVIPDNKLNFVPFETLVNPDTNLPLVAVCPVSYSHGLRLWFRQKESIPKPEKQELFVAFAPNYSTSYMNSFAEGNVTRGDRLHNIAGAAREAAHLAEAFDGQLYQGEYATKHHFLQEAIDYKIYHFAMHALIDESEHLNSSLVFHNDEHLRYHELYGLFFPAELVVLSACNTGVGKLRSGEGLMSLSRALTYSGVRSSVYSLWEVPDKETSEIMISFYEYLKLGHPKSEALMLAKRNFLESNPLRNHPFFWAGFVVNGNTDALSDSPLDYWNNLLAGVGVFLLALTSWILWKRKRILIR
ncbi:CHAT domain-containing protein [Sunxiuqinia elliptica]|uniref:CHAT domain-containing protein n=1 Tax=Sunxiuqinia elliptica TaxID=655355 RepID=A0A4R6H5P0_9BACT|nr:CHAT domain-containing tetratricopeptide repeat protein [Sunxiuqinia elliptica]TDO02786.1 CHAT domain-containing protein [Sunxiuqinia elliptica]TDO58475.1 CHAT domain-containing protein [Sunxiuqinia elliptica]